MMFEVLLDDVRKALNLTEDEAITVWNYLDRDLIDDLANSHSNGDKQLEVAETEIRKQYNELKLQGFF